METNEQLVALAKAGDQSAAERLIKKNRGMIYRLARRQARHRNDYEYFVEDLVQVGNMALLRAVKGFDPNIGNRFTTLLWRAALVSMRIESTRDGEIYVPAEAYNKKSTAPHAEFVRRGITSLSQDAGDSGRSLSSLIEDDRVERPSDNLELQEDLTQLRKRMAKLDPRSRRIIHDRMNGKSLQEIGDELGITTEAVRQNEIRAKKKLAS